MQTCQPSLSRAINSTGQTMVGTKREAEVSGPDSPSKRQAQASGDVTCDMTRASCPLHSYIILDTPACFPPVAERCWCSPGGHTATHAPPVHRSVLGARWRAASSLCVQHSPRTIVVCVVTVLFCSTKQRGALVQRRPMMTAR